MILKTLPLISLLLIACSTLPSSSETAEQKSARRQFTQEWEALLSAPPQERTPAGLLDKIFPSKEAKSFSREDQLAISSSEALAVRSAKIIIDNDESFREKIASIQKARSGETIRIAYYIFSPDHSSSVFYNEIIQASKRGVTIKILADALTNYQHLDLFHYLVREGGKNIQVKIFWSPHKSFNSRLTILDSAMP